MSTERVNVFVDDLVTLTTLVNPFARSLSVALLL